VRLDQALARDLGGIRRSGHGSSDPKCLPGLAQSVAFAADIKHEIPELS
jgi:hypothetical protein